MQHQPEGIHNFRELGPYPVRPGGTIRSRRIFRSGALERMTPADEALLAGELGIRTVLDLRHPDELAGISAGHPLVDRVVRLSIFSESQPQEELIAELNGLYGPGPSPRRYFHYLQIGGDRLARAFELFADEANYPVLVHCTAGKDRTGFAAALILLTLGVPRDVVMHDYLLTNALYQRPPGMGSHAPEEVLRVLWRVQEEFLDAALHMVDNDFGGLQAYLVDVLGVDAAAQKELAGRYLQTA